MDWEKRARDLQAENDELREMLTQMKDRVVDSVHDHCRALFPIEWDLTATEARMFGVILDRPLLTHAMFCTIRAIKVHGLFKGGDTQNLFKTHVCRLRKKIPTVQIKLRWGVGYYLEPKDKDTIRAIIKQSMEGQEHASEVVGRLLHPNIAGQTGTH